jgi:hypothetical protein
MRLSTCIPVELEGAGPTQESAVNIAKHKETVGDALDEAHRDRSRRGLPQPQHHYENHQAEHHGPRE